MSLTGFEILQARHQFCWNRCGSSLRGAGWLAVGYGGESGRIRQASGSCQGRRRHAWLTPSRPAGSGQVGNDTSQPDPAGFTQPEPGTVRPGDATRTVIPHGFKAAGTIPAPAEFPAVSQQRQGGRVLHGQISPSPSAKVLMLVGSARWQPTTFHVTEGHHPGRFQSWTPNWRLSHCSISMPANIVICINDIQRVKALTSIGPLLSVPYFFHSLTRAVLSRFGGAGQHRPDLRP